VGIVKHSMIENDVVKLLVPVGDRPVGTFGTAISTYDDVALVEVSDERTGEGLDMFIVPAESLEIQPLPRSRRRTHGSEMEAPTVVIASRSDLQL
jgi:hypothetical protein